MKYLRAESAATVAKVSQAQSLSLTPGAQSSFDRNDEPDTNIEGQLSATVTTTTETVQNSTPKSRRRFSSGGNFTYTVPNRNTVTVVPQQNLTTTTTTTGLNSVTTPGLNLDVVATKPWVGYI